MIHLGGPESWTLRPVCRWAATAILGLCSLVLIEENLRLYVEKRHWNEFLTSVLDSFPDLNPVLAQSWFWTLFGASLGSALVFWIVKLVPEHGRVRPGVVAAGTNGHHGDMVLTHQDLDLTGAAERPRYVKNDEFFNHLNHPVSYAADTVSSGDRLRIFVDYSKYIDETLGIQGWSKRIRVLLYEKRDFVAGERLIVSILSRYDTQKGKAIKWGEPDKDFGPGYIFLTGLHRCRIAIIGPDGREQYRYFVIVPATEFGQINVPAVIDEQGFTYKRQWEYEDAQ